MKTLEELRGLATWWKDVLGLGPYRITLEIDASILPNLGVCLANPDYWEADIRLAPPDKFPGSVDVEEVLVHELVHLHYAPLGTKAGTRERSDEEKAVELLARAFVALKRRGVEAPDLRARASRAIREGVRARRAATGLLVHGGREGARHRMDPKKLAELATMAGALIARDDVPEEVKAFLQELVAALAGAGQGEAAPASEPPPEGQAPATGAPPGADDNKAPMRALGPWKDKLAVLLGQLEKAGIATPAAPARAPATGRKALTVEDIDARLREHNERARLLADNKDRPGMTPELAAHLETLPLPDVRTILGKMAPKPAPEADARVRAGGATSAAPPGVPPRPIPPAPPAGVGPATAAADDLTDVEKFVLAHVDRQLGVKEHILEDVRARALKNEPIGVTGDAHLERLRKIHEEKDPQARMRAQARNRVAPASPAGR